jgi:membrane-anchored glycerophosphoryl diester phosphodiesterase (GDPDase)
VRDEGKSIKLSYKQFHYLLVVPFANVDSPIASFEIVNVAEQTTEEFAKSYSWYLLVLILVLVILGVCLGYMGIQSEIDELKEPKK